MARARGPGNLVSHAPRSEARTDTPARADYESMIDHDLGGRRQNSYRAIDDGSPVGAAELLLRPILLFLFACLAFVIVLALWLWQVGVFGQMQLNFAPRQPVLSSTWIAGQEARAVRPVDTTDAATLSGSNTSVAMPADTASSVDETAANNAATDSSGD